jgi:hypothetical protein
MLSLKPDILILQELDVECERTNSMDVPAILGKLLKMKVVFATEFTELKHDCRLRYSHVGQGGQFPLSGRSPCLAQ